MIRLTLENVGKEDYTIRGGPGWGRYLTFKASENGKEFHRIPIDPHVTHGDTGHGPLYHPKFFFTGVLPPGGSQHIVHIIQTKDMEAGELELKAIVWQKEVMLEAVVKLKLVEGGDEGGHSVFKEKEKRLIHKRVVYLHNRLGCRGGRSVHISDHERLKPMVEKAIKSEEKSTDVEYAVYLGVLRGFARQATQEDLDLADQAVQTLVKRFPKSWLRAHVYAALYMIHGDKRRDAYEEGRKLPESQPLYKNVGIESDPKKLDNAE